MVDVLSMLEALGSVLSGILATYIAWKSLSAFRLTERRHLVNFSAGFLSLGASFVVFAYVIIYLPGDIGENPARLVLEVAGFALLASSYLTKGRSGSAVLLGSIAVAAVVSAASASYDASFENIAALGTIHLLDMALVLYVMFEVSRTYTQKIVSGGIFVVWGFGALAVAQYTWVIWSYIPGYYLAGAAMAVRLIGLVFLVLGLEKE